MNNDQENDEDVSNDDTDSDESDVFDAFHNFQALPATAINMIATDEDDLFTGCPLFFLSYDTLLL